MHAHINETYAGRHSRLLHLLLPHDKQVRQAPILQHAKPVSLKRHPCYHTTTASHNADVFDGVALSCKVYETQRFDKASPIITRAVHQSRHGICSHLFLGIRL